LQIGRYQILKQLATGSIADVLLARASGLEGFARHVVLKRIKPELASEDKFATAFLAEARIAASLNHQNIVQVHDIGEQDGAYFFAMEYVHGEDVRSIIARVRERGEAVPLEIAVAIIMAAASGLHHAHEKVSTSGEKLNIVHRDVAPSNILVGYDGSVKLVDFGLAKAAQRSTTTAAGTLKGKASYMSPEQCKGENVDRRTDTFGLGIVLFELVTAQRLFKGPTEYATMAAVVDGEIPPPSRIRADVPPALDAIILRALSRGVSDRYQTAESFRAAVEAFAVEYQLRTSNKALSDYLIRLFGQRPEPWEAGGDIRPVTDDTLAGERGLARAPEKEKQPVAIAPANPIEPTDDDDDGEFDEDEVGTTVMRQSDEMEAVRAEADAAGDEVLTQRGAGRAASENEEFASTVVGPPVFEDGREKQPAGKGRPRGPESDTDVAKPLGKRPPGRAGAPAAAAAMENASSNAMDAGTTTPMMGAARGGGGIPNGAPAGAAIPPPAPIGMPFATGGLPPTPGYPAPSVFSQMASQPPPNEFAYGGEPVPSLSKLDGFKRWFALYRQSILLGGGMGVAVVLIALLVSRGCGDHARPSAKLTPPADAQEEPAPAVAAPAETPDAVDTDPGSRTVKKKLPHKASGSAH
jgi:serine/threonine protein kinase